MYNERKSCEDRCLEELFAPKAIKVSYDDDDDEDKTLDDKSKVLEKLFSQEAVDRGRPKALCYEDVLLMVVCHLDTGEDVLAMSIKFMHHKGVDNKPKPTIFFFTTTRRLIFCLITVIISLALHDGAFDAPSLASARLIFQAKVRGPVKYTPIRWKKEWLKRPIFRRYNGPILSENEPLQYQKKLKDDMEWQSLDYGCERAIGPKAWRRGAANVANGNASDAVRDQMMRHDPKWATLNSVYINEKVKFHLQNKVLGEPTEDSLIGMLTHVYPNVLYSLRSSAISQKT